MKRKILQTVLLLMLGVFLSATVTAQVNMNKYITLTVQPNVQIELDFMASSDNTTILLSEPGVDEYVTVYSEWWSVVNDDVYQYPYVYTTSSNTLTIYGDLNGFNCANSNISALDVSHNKALTELYCRGNQLSSLDVSHNTALEYLSCSDNQLTSLDVSHNMALTWLWCYGNPFSTAAVDALFCSLPDKEVSDDARIYILWNASDANHADVLDSNKQNALDKNWAVKYYYGAEPDIPATTGSYTCPELNMNRYITLTVQQGEDILLDLRADAENTPVKIVSGSQVYNIMVGTGWIGLTGYTAGATTMTIYGNIKGFSASLNGNYLTGLDASHNTALTNLVCFKNNLSSLDVSKNTALWNLACSNNNLSSLDVSQNTALTRLICYGNPLSTYQIDQLFCSLPDKSVYDDAKLYILNNTSDANYANVLASNKQNALDKNWKVWYHDNTNGSLNDTDIPSTTGDYECEVQTYELYIAGVQVDENNADNLSGIEGVSGTVSYNNDTKTLTLENASIDGSGNSTAIEPYINDFKITLIGSNNINADSYTLDIYGNTEINGNGSLVVSGSEYAGIYLNSVPLTIKDCTIETSGGDFGIVGDDGESGEDLVIENATVKTTGTDIGSIKDVQSLTLVDCSITAPAGAAFDANLHGVALNGSLVTEQVVIEPIETYELYIAGVQVTSENASDLSVIEGVSGTVSYNHATKTLTLENASIDGSISAIETFINDFKITLIGSNNINAEEVTLDVYENTEINGNGSLTVLTNNAAIYVNEGKQLTIKDCMVEAISNYYGIVGESTILTIDNATVKATGANYGSIKDIYSLTLVGCSITTPEGAVFDEDLNGVALNGSIVTEQVVIEPFNSIEETEILGVSVYPNPALDFVEISIDDANIKGLELQVYDVLGKLIIQQAITEQTTQLNIKNLEKGVYILKVGNNTQRFVKE